MHSPPHRLALLCALLLLPLLPARAVNSTAVPPIFLTGTGGAFPDYTQASLRTLPVGKTLVLPVVLSGSGPMTYSASSSSPALIPILKTGYPVLDIAVSYSGTTAVSGTLVTLYPFTGGTDGAMPRASLIQASDGTLYGAALTGGTNNNGTLFNVSTTGAFSTVHPFTGGTDGAMPSGALIESSGNFFGTTGTGGTGGFGTLFQVTASGTLTTIHAFSGGADGGTPLAGLVTGTDDNLYGTTSTGGTNGFGTLFQLVTSGSIPVFNTLYSFTGGSDGADPRAPLIVGPDGNLYGTTLSGGSGGHGTIFQVTLTGSLSTLYSFSGGADGGSPYGSLLTGSDGNFYGTTETGGTSGFGTVYQLAATGSLTTLHTFSGGADGANPFAGLLQATGGNLLGTAETGGTAGFGTIYQVSTSGSLTTLYTFTGAADGGNPYASLLQAADGSFYGVAATGGTSSHGTVYKLAATSSAPFAGTMSFALLRDMAPVTSAFIAGFAQGGYYDGTPGHPLQFFRITNLSSSGNSSFIAQAGAPTNTTAGTPGFSFDDEPNPSLIFSGEGQLAMANAGINPSTFRGTNGSQFFITQNNSLRALDFQHTIFGQLLTGFDVMNKLMAVQTGTDGSSPTVPVDIDSVSVSEDDTDAILLVSAAGSVPGGASIHLTASDPLGNKAVTPSTTGTTTSPGLTISLSTFDDTVNDPPILLPDTAPFASLHQKVSLPIRARDLEFDYMIPGATLLSGSSGSVSVSGNIATVTPFSTSPIGGVTVGLYAYEPFISGNPEAEIAVNVGLGTGKLTPSPALLTATTGGLLGPSLGVATGTTAFGSFLSSNPHDLPANFTASINWGDGVLTTGTGTISSSGTGGIVSSGTASAFVLKSPALPTGFTIAAPAGHAYAGPGIYPVNVTVTDTNGAILRIANTAVVSDSNIYAFGRTFTASKGSFDGVVATFVDSTIAMPASDYLASINWGDGSVTPATAIRGSSGSFQIYGRHKYAAGNTYPVDVTITSSANPYHSGYAWSTATLSGVATRQPPFAQSHIVAELGNPGFGNGFIDEEVTLFNSGDIPSGTIVLKFYLSPTASPTITSSDIPLQIGKGTTYTAISIPAGQAISGAVSDIVLPSGVVSRGKFLIMQVITSDPIGSHMDYPRVFIDSNPLIE